MTSSIKTVVRNLKFHQGMDTRVGFFWTLDENPEVPVDFTGYSARLQLKLTPASVAVLTLHSGPSGGIELGPTPGEIWLDFASDDVLALIQAGGNDPVTYGYDLRIVDPAGKVSVPVKGAATVDPRITSEA